MRDKKDDGNAGEAGAEPGMIASEPAGEAAAPNPAHEALAGALPQWDLVPANPFIRRR